MIKRQAPFSRLQVALENNRFVSKDVVKPCEFQEPNGFWSCHQNFPVNEWMKPWDQKQRA